MHFAVGSGNDGMARLLMEHGADLEAVDDTSWTPLFYAVLKDREMIVRLLLRRHLGKDEAHELAQTTDAQAANTELSPILEPLSMKSANVHQIDLIGRTPLSLAASIGNNTVVRLLLDNGASVDHEDDDGYTPLFLATQWEYLATMQLLLDKGACIDHQDKCGRTPLFDAAKFGLDSAVHVLLENGARLDLQDTNGKTARDIAAEANNYSIALLLQDVGEERGVMF
jgi:uncharacterized protein